MSFNLINQFREKGVYFILNFIRIRNNFVFVSLIGIILLILIVGCDFNKTTEMNETNFTIGQLHNETLINFFGNYNYSKIKFTQSQNIEKLSDEKFADKIILSSRLEKENKHPKIRKNIIQARYEITKLIDKVKSSSSNLEVFNNYYEKIYKEGKITKKDREFFKSTTKKLINLNNSTENKENLKEEIENYIINTRKNNNLTNISEKHFDIVEYSSGYWLGTNQNDFNTRLNLNLKSLSENAEEQIMIIICDASWAWAGPWAAAAASIAAVIAYDQAENSKQYNHKVFNSNIKRNK